MNNTGAPSIEAEAPCDGFAPVGNPALLEPIRPVQLSLEPSLTALAQLGALKLGCQRSFISIIDHNTQYVLAEATRTVSLLEQHIHGEGDALFLGVQSLPLHFGVCPSTIKAFTDTTSRYSISTANVTADVSRYVIRDFTLEDGTKDRPYVAGWPFMRFYAEVPLRSPSGYVIGSYCVSDNRPRAVFRDDDVAVLQEISNVIANHLELMRMKQDYERAERLMRGLSSFVEGQSSIRDPSHSDIVGSSSAEAERRSIGKSPRLLKDTSPLIAKNGHRSTPRSEMHGSATDAISLDGIHSTKTMSPHETASSPATTPSTIEGIDRLAVPPSSAAPISTNLKHTLSRAPSIHARPRSILQKTLVSESIKEIFSRASNLIRESMDLCGTVFFDGYLGGLARRSKFRRDRIARLDTDHEDETASSSEEDWALTNPAPTTNGIGSAALGSMSPSLGGLSRKLLAKSSEVLGCSIKSDKTILKGDVPFPAPLLQRLSKRYPHGQIFNFNQAESVACSNDRLRDEASIIDGRSSIPSRKRKRKVAKDAEASSLLNFFPGARSLIFYPLWDSHKSRWYAGCLGWTTDPKRALQAGEVTYLAAFGNSIMSEVSRLEAVATDRAKSDFISSISHELRSPLHGILASAELLQDSSTGPDQDGMIEMVNSCGRTLLDTMNHLYVPKSGTHANADSLIDSILQKSTILPKIRTL